VQRARGTHVPLHGRIAEPQTRIDGGDGAEHDGEPCLRRVVAGEEHPHEGEAGRVEQGMPDIQVNHMSAQQPPPLAGGERTALVTQQHLPARAREGR